MPNTLQAVRGGLGLMSTTNMLRAANHTSQYLTGLVRFLCLQLYELCPTLEESGQQKPALRQGPPF